MSQTSTARSDHTGEMNTQSDLQPQVEEADTSHGSKKQKGRGGPPKKRDTHFLCFPLVTETSVPQLAESLRQFRQITTKPRHVPKGQQKIENDNNGAGHESKPQESSGSNKPITGGHDELEPNSNYDHAVQSSMAGLDILPAIAHRPAGTFHLTLGVMDLSEQEDMDRALNLLQELDYAEILHRVLGDHESVSTRPPRGNRYETPLTGSKAAARETGDRQLASLERPISPPSASNTPGEPSVTYSKDTPPSISLTGLSTFPSARSSRVFYAKPSPTATSQFPLLSFGQAIRRKFRDAGFITETRPLVLHATVANMRYATQARGGRTSKGKTWRYGKDRWKDGEVDARELIKCFDQYGGNIQGYLRGGLAVDEQGQEFVWARNIAVERVALCKMGAVKSEDEVLGMVYPPVGEKFIFA